MKKEVRSQAALEFLTTYAWAFLALMVVIGALYYFGVFNFSKFLPQKCIFPSQFECLDFSFVGDEVKFKLVNNVGEKMMVTGLDITNDAAEHLSCSIPQAQMPPFEWESGVEYDFSFTDCQDGAFIVGERAEAKISMTYYAISTPSQPRHQVNGKITAVVNPA